MTTDEALMLFKAVAAARDDGSVMLTDLIDEVAMNAAVISDRQMTAPVALARIGGLVLAMLRTYSYNPTTLTVVAPLLQRDDGSDASE